ncbi:MAG: metallophosphoesterase family protein [Cytophagaceae bacterium]|nr:metallophosphoesterase family protein [Gemmatimonadaceae bacterium]
MRLALISDIHGNTFALDAVLADARAMAVDETWFLGDFSAIGPDPSGVLERVTSVDRARFLRGNTDRYTCTNDRPPPALADVLGDPSQVDLYASISASFAWTRGFVSATGWFDWLAQLPLDIRETIDGMRLLAVHAAPGTDDGPGIHPGQGDAELSAMLDGCNADVVIVGHTHEAMLRRLGALTLVNLGSVSNPRSGDLRASYVILEIARDGVFVQHRRVPYDHDAFSAQVRASHHPATEFILAHQRGEMLARPRHPENVEPIPGIRVALR